MYVVPMLFSAILFLGCLVAIISELICNKALRIKGLNPKEIYKYTILGALFTISKVAVGVMLVATLVFGWLANQSEADRQKDKELEEQLSSN